MITSKVLDRGAIELLGPFGLTNSLYGGSRNIALLDTSVVTDYAMYIMIGLLSLVLIIFSNVFSLDFRFVIVIIATLLCTFKSPFYFLVSIGHIPVLWNVYTYTIWTIVMLLFIQGINSLTCVFILMLFILRLLYLNLTVITCYVNTFNN